MAPPILTARGSEDPEGNCNLYDFGVQAPLMIRWSAAVKPGRVVDDFVSALPAGSEQRHEAAAVHGWGRLDPGGFQESGRQVHQA